MVSSGSRERATFACIHNSRVARAGNSARARKNPCGGPRHGALPSRVQGGGPQRHRNEGEPIRSAVQAAGNKHARHSEGRGEEPVPRACSRTGVAGTSISTRFLEHRELNGLSPSFAYEYVSLCAKPGPPARPQNAYLVVLVDLMQFDKQREREETFKGDL